MKFQRDEDQEKYEQDVRREQQRALEDQKKKEGLFLYQLHEFIDPMGLVALMDRAKEIVDAPYKQNFQKEYDHARGELLDKYRNEHNGKSPGLLEQYRISEQAKKQAVDKLGYSVSTLDETLNQVAAIGMMSPGMTTGRGPVVVPGTTRPPNGVRMSTGAALTEAEKFLGPGYKQVAPGQYVSADGTRRVRLTDADLAGVRNHAGGPHMNFEEGKTITKPNGKESFVPKQNSHVYLPEEK